MSPTLFETELFGRAWAVNGYGLMVGLGVVSFGVLVAREAARLGYELMRRRIVLTCAVLVASLYAGGKILFAITAAGDVEVDPLDVQSGFVFYGAMLLGVPVMLLWARFLGVPVLVAMDIYAYGCPLGHALGRVGCFLAGCCYGHACELPWAVTFEESGFFDGVAVHPVQLYEVAGLVALFAVLHLLRKRKSFDGQVGFAYLIGYSVLRAITETFRGDPDRRFPFHDGEVAVGAPPPGLSTSVLISIIVAATSLAVLFWLRRRGHLRRLGG